MYAGETLLVRVRGIDPVSRDIITDAVATAYFYAPPKDPASTPADRTPDYTAALDFDGFQFYAAQVPTTGWPAGTWWVQGKVTGGAGGYDSWAYSSFELSA